MVKYKVTLTAKEREELLEITKGGTHNSKKIIHALILLNCDEGKYSEKVKNEDIAKVLDRNANNRSSEEKICRRWF